MGARMHKAQSRTRAGARAGAVSKEKHQGKRGQEEEGQAGDTPASTQEVAIGRSIIAVEVLVIHIDNRAPATMKPRMSFRPSVPVLTKTLSAIRLCKPHLSTESASKKAPRKRNMVG